MLYLKYFLISILLFSYPRVSNSLSILKPVDTLHPINLNRNEIESKYGTDDSSKALIRYFFKKKDRSKKNMIIWGIIAVLAAISIMFLFTMANLAWLGLLLFVELVLVDYYAGFVLLFYAVIFFLFNKKRLIRLLERYQHGGGIPKSIRKRKSFIKEINLRIP